MEKIRKNIVIILPVLIGLAYGLLMQFGIRNKFFVDTYGAMSIGFIFILPFLIGSITVYFGNEVQRKSWKYRITMPLLTSLLCMLCSFFTGLEGTICLFMAIPVYVPLAILGGVITGIILSSIEQNKFHSMAFASLLFLPLISNEMEKNFPLPDDFNLVKTQIFIEGTEQKVWNQIKRIPKITEPQNSFFYTMGFPRPVEATLSFNGIGGVREAKFEKGLLFLETIDVWEENKKLGFKIKSDPNSTPLTTLDEHVMVGGKYFDALYGEYEIVKISETKVRLDLHSRYRLSTRFNFYAELWGDFLMRDIQNNILSVIKSRVEKN